MNEPKAIQELRAHHSAAFEAEDWPRIHWIGTKIIREWARFHAAEDRKQKRLIKEAREIIVEQGESIDVPLQFKQHGWLAETEEVLNEKA